MLITPTYPGVYVEEISSGAHTNAHLQRLFYETMHNLIRCHCFLAILGAACAAVVIYAGD